MKFSQIRYFLAVAETLSFTRAAEKCAVSQPALSKAIQDFEASLGGVLFERHAHGVMLTDFGRTMRIHFERIDENRRRALEAAQEAASMPSMRLDIGILCTLGPNLISPFLIKFQETFPNCELTLHDVTEPVVVDSLLDGSLHAVFAVQHDFRDNRLTAMSLYEEEIVLAFSTDNPLRDASEVTFEDIANHPYIDRLHCEFRETFFSVTRGLGLDLNVVLRTEREDWIPRFLQSDLGVTILGRSIVAADDIDCRPIVGFDQKRKIDLLTADPMNDTPILEAFRNAADDYSW